MHHDSYLIANKYVLQKIMFVLRAVSVCLLGLCITMDESLKTKVIFTIDFFCNQIVTIRIHVVLAFSFF